MEAQEYSFIKHKILNLTGVNLNCYKSPQMQRRLNTFLLRSGHSTWQNFFQATEGDPVALGKLKDYLTINVSSFFRDVEKYEYLKESILPELRRGRSKLRVWSAGCSRGQEPYSLAMMLAETTSLYNRHYILATDLDRSTLEWAQAGGPYSATDVATMSPHLRQSYFKLQDNSYWVRESLQRRVTFKQHNLLADPFEGDFDLIVCRNVVIYFTAPIKEQLYERFYRSLRPGGVLFVGGTEIVAGASEIGFKPVGISFYHRHN